MIKKITLETLYTPYTLDTYQIFTLDYAVDTEIWMYNDLNKTDFTYDDFEIEYNTTEYLKKLADNLVKLLNKNIVDDVILNISYNGEVYSPRQYNYTTDFIFLDFKVNNEKLDKYIAQNKEDYEQKKIHSCSGFVWHGDEDDTRLNYYLQTVSSKKYSTDNYINEQLDDVMSYEFVELNKKKLK